MTELLRRFNDNVPPRRLELGALPALLADDLGLPTAIGLRPVHKRLSQGCHPTDLVQKPVGPKTNRPSRPTQQSTVSSYLFQPG